MNGGRFWSVRRCCWRFRRSLFMLLIIFLSTNKRVGLVTDLKRSVCVNDLCVWAYLQAFIVPAAAAVALLGHVLLQVEDGAETAEIPWRGNHKLLTCGGRPWERLITSSSFQKTKFKLKHGCMLVTCVSPRGLLGLKGGRMKSAGSHGDAERDCLASGPASSLLSLLSAEKNTRAR